METESRSLPRRARPPQTPIEIDNRDQVMRKTLCYEDFSLWLKVTASGKKKKEMMAIMMRAEPMVCIEDGAMVCR